MTQANGKVVTKTIPSISVEAQTLLKRLLRAAIGEIVTYDELSQLIGRDVRPSAHRAYVMLVTAKKKALAEQNYHFEAVRGVGLKRCSDAEKVDGAQAYLGRARTAATKAARVATSVDDFEGLSSEMQIKHNMLLSQAGLIRQATDARTAKKIANVVKTQQSVLPPALMLQAFRDS